MEGHALDEQKKEQTMREGVTDARDKERTIMTPVPTTVEFLRAVLAAAEMGGGRGRLDTFADRLVKAASEPTLSAACEHLLRAVHASVDAIHPPLAARMLSVAGSPDGPRVLRWWRESAKLATLLASTRDQGALDAALAATTLPDAETAGTMGERRAFEIGITASCESPLAHGADTKAGNATIFRRMQVMTQEGGVLSLPYYAGNALRGQLRDLLADHFLSALGLPASRTQPAVALWFFYALYSGGALEEKSSAQKALTKQLGDHGAIRAMGIRAFREHCPVLSLLGCALGNRVLPGRLFVADLRPSCREWGTGERPVAELLTWEYLTRREDHEEHEEHHGMIANTEVLRAGAELDGGIDCVHGISAIERAALGRGLQLLRQRGMLGAENRRGMGRVRMDLVGCPDPAPYDDWLVAQKATVLEYLGSVDALAGLLA